ncbi:MAG: PDGLE domain-containing protein [Candidatus Odinarchaeum yellowstonii]|uniref:PDGLE domain-containing protein n=1 Tax=Odinarchaeota yellowstonii (strain LCB_4) TaxID=1841599 RepID=A0AAF0D263_ODILC|nr:MAG: PDGLE domain-containing protein [Candidatus Odinarchaeum yellowstonii]
MGLKLSFPRWAKISLAAIVILLAVFIPLASAFPDGLEKVAEELGVVEGEPIWNAPIPDYFINIGGDWAGTLIAGLIGVAITAALTIAVSILYVKFKKHS